MTADHATMRLFLSPEVEAAIRPLGGLVLALMRGDDNDETAEALGVLEHSDAALLLAALRMIRGLIESLADQRQEDSYSFALRWALGLARDGRASGRP